MLNINGRQCAQSTSTRAIEPLGQNIGRLIANLSKFR